MLGSTDARRERFLTRCLAVCAALWAIPAAATTPETVSFPSLNADATPIRGLLYRPAGEGPFPAVVMMHGCSGLFRKNGEVQINLAAWIGRFTGWGYLVLAVDGFTPRGFRTICATAKRPLHPLDDRPFDAYGGLAWLSAQPFAKKDRAALVGWSNGAMATLSGMRANRVKKFTGELRFRAAAAFYPGCASLSKRTKGKYRPYAPLLVLVGLSDNWTQPKPCVELMEAAKESGEAVEIVGYDGAYHAFDHPNLPIRDRTARDARWKQKERRVTIGSDPAAREDSIRRLRSWLERHLGGG